MRGRGNAVRGTPSQADREESLSDDTVSGVRRLKGAPIGPTATSKHELPVFRSSFLASQRGASVLLKTHTGDKGPNTHWAHGENIEITVNM